MQDLFRRKTYGRIFVQRAEDIPRVEEAIREVDAFESAYLPLNLVTVFVKEKNPLIYLHKFEIDKIALTQACLGRGIWIWCVDGGKGSDSV